jgi:hypothetical protein
MKSEKGKVKFSIKGEVFKSDFQDDDLVQKLLAGKIIRKHERFDSFVIFDEGIKDEKQFKERLNQIGITKTEAITNIWRNSQEINYPPSCSTVFQKVINAARSMTSQGPFYVQINIMEVHSPWLLVRPEFKKNFLNLKDNENPLYHDAVRQVSHDINLFITRLIKIPGWDNTLFIITSDHGEGLNDHPLVAKSEYHGRLLYESQLKVPMIWFHPHYQESKIFQWAGELFPQTFFYLVKGKKINRTVRLLDLMPSLLDYLGISKPHHIHGKSVLQLINEENSGVGLPEFFVAETYFRKSNKIAVYSDQWKYIENRRDHEGVNRFELQPIGVKENGKATDKIEEKKEISLIMKKFLLLWEKRYSKEEAISTYQKLTKEESKQLKSLGYLN